LCGFTGLDKNLSSSLPFGQASLRIARGNFPLAHVFKKTFHLLINNSLGMDKDVTKCLMSDCSPSVEGFAV